MNTITVDFSHPMTVDHHFSCKPCRERAAEDAILLAQPHPDEPIGLMRICRVRCEVCGTDVREAVHICSAYHREWNGDVPLCTNICRGCSLEIARCWGLKP